MKGLGSDIVEIVRIKSLYEAYGDRLAQRILTPQELESYAACTQPWRFLAKRFAVKEAVSKALGTGFREGVSWQHIEIQNTSLGQPQAQLLGHAKARAEALGASDLQVTLSDERHYVVAFAVLT